MSRSIPVLQRTAAAGVSRQARSAVRWEAPGGQAYRAAAGTAAAESVPAGRVRQCGKDSRAAYAGAATDAATAAAISGTTESFKPDINRSSPQSRGPTLRVLPQGVRDFAVRCARDAALGDDGGHVLAAASHRMQDSLPHSIRRDLLPGQMCVTSLAARCSMGILLPSGVSRSTVEIGAAT